MFAVIDDQRGAHGLATLRGTGTTRQNRHPFFGCNLQGADRGITGSWHDDTDGHDLVNRRIGGIASAVCRIKHDFAVDFAPQTRLKRARLGRFGCKMDGSGGGIGTHLILIAGIYSVHLFNHSVRKH